MAEAGHLDLSGTLFPDASVPVTDRPADYTYLDTVPPGTGERRGPFYRCLMVTTGREEEVRRLLRALGLGEGILPRRVRVRKSGGAWKEDTVPLLPGYLLVHEETEVPIWKYQMLVDVIRVLRYDREPYGYMRERDLKFAETVFGLGGTVSPLRAVREGDYIRITDGLLENLCGRVLSVDRHKRQAKVRIVLMGTPRVVYMNYELLEKDGELPELPGQDADGSGRPEGGEDA